MSTRVRFQMIGSITFVCLVWLAISSQNVSRGIYHSILGYPQGNNHDTDKTAIYSYTSSDDKDTVPHQSAMIPYIQAKALQELPFCSSSEIRNEWNFTCKVQCPDPHFATAVTKLQPKFQITCDTLLDTDESPEVSGVNDSVPMFNFTDQCFRDELYKLCSDDEPVPNIVHYVFFGIYELTFFHFLSIWSIHVIQKPCAILIHGNTLVSGPLWDRLVKAATNLIRVRRAPPSGIFGNTIHLIEHKADVARLEAVRDFGGIYMDSDEILLRPLDPLRKYDFTLSHAYDYNLSNGLIMSSRNASFVNIWYSEYGTYNGEVWGHHSTIVPFELSQKHPHLIHVENKTFVNPDFEHVDLIFEENFDWRNNYAIHLFIRKYELEHNFTDIRHLNTTMGSVARHVLYGCKDICSD